MLGEDADAAEVAGIQPTLVGQGAHDRARAHALAMADGEAVDLHLVAVTVRKPRGWLVEALLKGTVGPAATAIGIPVTVIATTLVLAARSLLHEELLPALGTGRKCRGDVLQGDPVVLRVGGHQVAEHGDLRVLEILGQLAVELRLAGLVDLVNARQLDLVEAGLRRALDGLQHPALARGHEQHGAAGTPRTPGAADAVDIGLGVARDVVVKHVRDAFDIQAASGDVGGDQDVQATVLELVDGALALCLGNIAVDGGSLVASRAQALRELLGVILGANEHDHRIEVGDLENAGQGVQLLAVVHDQVVLLDVLRGALGGLDRHFLRLVEVSLGQVADRGGHRRREQRDLLILRGVLEDALHVLLEAHVQHLVGLVEHHEAQLGDIEATLLQVVDHAPRGADDYVRATAQAGELRTIRLAAVDRQDVDPTHFLREVLEGLSNLQGQLTGRREHQGLRLAGLQVQSGQDRQREGGSLTGTGLREADHVLPCHQQRDGLFLDWGRLGEADGTDGVEYLR